MPFRFRKSFKIAPGIKINLSKSGLSTSFGKRGASLNVGKRGVRSTVGLPGTGLSFSKLFGSPKLPKTKIIRNSFIQSANDQPDAPSDYNSSPAIEEDNKARKNSKFKIPFGCLIPIALITMCCQCFFVFAFANAIVNPQPTSTPTLTATITPSPISTSLPTQTSLPTNTPLPTETQTPLPTNTPYLTETLPANCLQEYPSFCILPGQRIACDQLPDNFIVLPPDSLGYDKDDDGIGCEN